MSRFAKTSSIAVSAAMVFLVAFASPASANLEVTDLSWETVGTSVHFLVRFHNADPVNPSGSASGMLSTQPFGAFVPNNGVIGTFDVPPLAPDSFFDITYDVSLADLPPSAETVLPGGGPGNAPGTSSQDCFGNPSWAGNVDVIWSGPGGSGQVNAHYGTIPVCPGAGASYIHVLMDCQDPAGVSWSFSGVCPGWSATLVADNAGTPGGPAPNPLPAGFFDGWICVTAGAGVPNGAICCFQLDASCGSQPATINICAEACIWEPVSTRESTWGKVKALYQD